VKVWFRGAALVIVSLAGSAEAAVFGVPTPLSTDGRVCIGAGNPAGCPSGPSIDPPGYFILSGTGTASSQGDAVHQLRLFIEVTGPVGASTLDIRVFDAGDSGARDTASSSNTHYQLLDPCTPFPTCTGAVRRTVVLTGELAGVTEDRLARFSANPADAAVFTTANTGTLFTGLNPGLYEFRVTMENAGTALNAFGVEVTDGAATPVAYNVFTIGLTDATLDTAFLGGARAAGVGTDPDASITPPMTFFPYVDHGCSIQTSNFDGDGTASASLLDALGNASALTVSANNARADNTITVHSTATTSYDSINYGMYQLTNDTGQDNNVDWRVADYRGWDDTNSPRDPTRPLRMYLPNGYSPVTGNANAVPPAEPILQSGFRYVSGANPPVLNSPTTYLVTGSLYNPGPGAISSVVLQVPIVAGGTVVPGSPAATLDGLAATCAEAGGLPGFLTGSTTALQCSFTAPVPVGSVASLTLQVTYTPAVAFTTLPITGSPSISVTTLTRAGGTATATTQYPHWFRTGDLVVIANANPVAYNNGGAPVTITGTPAANQFTYALAGSGANTSTTVTATEANTQNSVIALYTPAYASVAFPRTEAAGPVCQAVYVALPSVNLSVTKTDAPDPVVAGQNITYTITVTNTGAAAAPNASLSDPLPAATTFQSIAIGGAGAAGWTCNTPPVGANGTVSCAKPSLATGAGGTTTFTLVVQVAPTTTASITNTASVASGGQDTDPTNNSASATTAVNRRADLAVTKTDSPDPVQAGQDITYTITITNNGPSASSAVTLTEAVPANTTFRAIALPSGWSCPTLPAVGGTGAISCQGPGGLVAGGTARINLLVRVNGGVANGTTITNTATVSVPVGQDTVAGNNTATATTLVGAASTAPTCATGQSGAGGTLTGIVNTYYPGTASAAAAATSITLGAATGATPIAAGDLVLVIQMQDAAIDASNDERYGDGTGTAGNTAGNGSGATAQNNAGLYEYVMATNSVPLGGGTLTLGSGLVNAYTNAAATAGQGQRRFQVVRVPQYASATLGSGLTASPWDGTVGGILALDVTGNLALGAAAVNLSGRGFRGGLARQLGGGTGTGTDYRNPAAQNVHGSKAEGTAGTPRYVWSATVGAGVDTLVDGYPNGSSARGAPGNAGGGGTDSDPAANDENAGGGGGGNGGAGGLGGNTWRTNLPRGGFGGAAFPAAANRLVLGGGGGAGTRNNSAGIESSGGAGGALVMIRTNTTSGTGTITTDGDPGVEPDNDGGGGGGAGGTVLFLARGQATLAGLTINARGGQGSNAWPLQAPNGTPGERHGPGGGGAGGRVIVSGAPTAIVVTGGVNGTTTTAVDPFGATPGAGGQSASTLTDGNIPAACPVTDVGVTKTATPEPVLAGQNLTYTLTVTSLLTSANVTVTDTLPASLAFVSASTSRGTCSFASPTVACALGTLATGDVVIIDVVATVLATAIPPGTVTNTASVSTTSTDVIAANNSDTVVSTVTPAADLAVTKVGSPDPVQAGQDLTYTITVTNNGPSPAQSPSLDDPLPPGTTFQSLASPGGWSCSPPSPGTSGTVSCTAASLAAGASASFTLVVRVGTGTAPGASIINTATVATTTADPVAANNSATEITSTSAPAVLLTRATVRGLRVDRAGRVAFATGTQRGTRSFNLYATDDPAGTGGRILLNPEPVRPPVPDSAVPILYEVRTAPITARYLIIEETDARGQAHAMGPFVVGDERLAASYARVEKRLRALGVRDVRVAGAEHATRLAPREEIRARSSDHILAARRDAGARPAGGLKVEISRPGQVVLMRAALEAAGLPPEVPLPRVTVSTQGVPVASTIVDPGTATEAIAFQAEGLSTTYTGRSVYVLTWGSRPTMTVALSREEDPPTAGWARVSRHLIYDAHAPQGTSPWLWDVFFSDGLSWPDNGWDPEAGTFDLAGIPAGSEVTAAGRLRLVGGSDHTHIVDAWINGQPIGSVQFEGRSAAVLEGLATGLKASGNRLSLTYRTGDGSPDGLLLIDHLDLAVPPAPVGGAATVEGVSAFDRSLPPLSVSYLIVTHAAFAEQAERLAGLKRGEGLSVAVVDVERAYDRFSAGIVEAAAVRALVEQAFRGGRLRYLLLMGDDTYDPEGFSGLGEVSFVPSLYGWDGDLGRVPSENRYADVDGDGRPDVAIGRLPVRSAAEADAVVAKIAGQKEVLAAAAGRHLFVSDNQAPGESSFASEAQAIASRLPAGSRVAWASLDQGVDAARAALAAGMEASPSVVHYFGHGGPEVWADEHLLAVEDVAGLAGAGTVFLTWACQVQDYQYIFGRSVNEALLMKPEGGAVASFGPAGIADAAAQAAFYERLYAVLAARKISLGEAIRRAKGQALAADPRVGPVVESWNLLGDPAVIVDGLVAGSPEGR
jgi:uncharacterized repeat protein (TIGR01451 family)